MEPKIGEKQANVARSLEKIAEAAANGAQLVVLPELCNSGYVFGCRQEAFALAEPVPGGPTTKARLEAARRQDLVIVAGICERAGDALYNSAAIVGPDGFVGTYRKVHLWGSENLFFEPGDLGVPVWKTRFGRMAVAICYDGWFPETYRLAALQGADILCVPTNWVPMPDQPANTMVMANILAMSGAHSNSMYIAAADRVGVERNQPFLGSSLIVSHTGFPLAGPASKSDEDIIYAEVRQLDEMYPGLRESNSLLGPTRTIGAPVEQLDLATVLRVSVAVSSEIVPEKVIHTLLHTAIEHAGAERGVLIVPKGGEPRIQGRSGYCRRLGHDRSARLADLWSRNAGAGRALRRAHQENVILDDASTHGTFAGNNYVLRKHTRSILCLPLVKQGNAVALLYLENNLAPRVFTPARVAVLKFLASEAATSLDNALLYRELQDRESRIRRLFDANIIGMHIYNAKGVIALH